MKDCFFPTRRCSALLVAILLATFGLLAANGCSDSAGPEGPSTDSETHWMKPCVDSSDCGEELECLCNMCTTHCDEDCAGLFDGAVCVPGPSQCEPDTGSICLPSCSDDDECGDGYECSEDVCVLIEISGTNQSDNSGEPTESEKLDLLWMIDNSGSMCRSQEVVRDSIDELVELFVERGVDFQMGITTTHMVDCDDPDKQSVCAREPVAVAGHLQSTPQPIPGFDPACYYSVYGPDDSDVQAGEAQPGDPNTKNLDPVVANIETAVDCTDNPEEWSHLLDFDEAELRCAQPGDPLVPLEDCDPDGPHLSEFFPDPDSYRDLPKVFRAADYQDENGTVDVDEFRRDFACASMVGTRGYGIEQGLAAVTKALSHDLTGGPNANPDDYPNAGLIRPDANTGIIFVSDENDCSHDGGLDEQTQCGVHKCTIEENKEDEGHLLSVDDLYADFMDNLAASRGVETIDPNSVLPASIHAPYQKVEPADVPNTCPDEPWTASPSCETEMGRGWSGHRYEYFLRNFEFFFPEAYESDPQAPLDGLICHDFSGAFTVLAEYLASGAPDD